jgi:hypothetical protein
MSPLQRIAMGMVIVVGFAMFPANPSPDWRHYDALPDPIGWLLVLSGVFALVRADRSFESLRWVAGLAAAVSVPMWFPQLRHQLDDSGLWFASLPQIVFCLLLARAMGLIAARQRPPDGYVAKRCGLLVWGFALLAVLPVVALGGHVDQLTEPTQLLSWLVSLAFVYVLFRVHRREWLGGPGPLLVEPRTPPGRRPQTREGRPPSS